MSSLSPVIEKEHTIKLYVPNLHHEFRVDTITSYTSSNYRIVENDMQKKTNLITKKQLLYINDKFIPMIYTEAIEEQITQKLKPNDITSVKLRQIIKKTDTWRITVDHQYHKYFLCGEIENSDNMDDFLITYMQYFEM